MDRAELARRLAAAAVARGEDSSDFDLDPGHHLPPAARLRAAGVLVGVEPGVGAADDGWGGAQLILTKRSPLLRHHPGQIAFPGGRIDPGDADPIAAALREAEEEVGLPPDRVEVLGSLPPHETVTGFSVTPVLALVAPFEARAEAGEVAEVFRVPFAHVATPGNYRIEGRRWQGRRRHYFCVPWGPYYVWGATARILRGLAERLSR